MEAVEPAPAPKPGPANWPSGIVEPAEAPPAATWTLGVLEPLAPDEATRNEAVSSRINRILNIVKSTPDKELEELRGGRHGKRNRQRPGDGASKGKGAAASVPAGGEKNSRRGGNKEAKSPVHSLDEEANVGAESSDIALSAASLGPGSLWDVTSPQSQSYTYLNPRAAVFKPLLATGWGDDGFPNVVCGERENEYLGLQWVGEIGEWVVLRENLPNSPPFFWHRITLAKQWEAPQSVVDLGMEETLKKWAIKLPVKKLERDYDINGPYMGDCTNNPVPLHHGKGAWHNDASALRQQGKGVKGATGPGKGVVSSAFEAAGKGSGKSGRPAGKAQSQKGAKAAGKAGGDKGQGRDVVETKAEKAKDSKPATKPASGKPATDSSSGGKTKWAVKTEQPKAEDKTPAIGSSPSKKGDAKMSWKVKDAN